MKLTVDREADALYLDLENRPQQIAKKFRLA